MRDVGGKRDGVFGYIGIAIYFGFLYRRWYEGLRDTNIVTWVGCVEGNLVCCIVLFRVNLL